MPRKLVVVLVAFLLAGCATNKVENLLTQTLDSYAATLRWGDFESALQYVDPAVLKANPPTDLELARYRQVRVSMYDASSVQPVSETEVRQRVMIGIINQHTQRERAVVDNQTWKYDAVTNRWWLQTGLPKIVD